MPTTSRSARLERLVAAGSELTAELSLDGVLQRVADLARELLGARYAAIGLLAPDGKTLDSFITSGLTQEQREHIGALPRGHGLLGLVIREARVVRLPDLAAHPASSGFPPNHPPMHSFLGVPVVGRRGVLGDLYLTEKLDSSEFSEEDEYVAILLAAMTAAAVENARLHEESARLLEEVQQLHRTRERFFAMVNHEVRNALAAVFGWAEMLVRKKDPKTVPRAAFEVLESAEHAIGLINDLLDLSRLDEDRLRPTIRNVECGGVVRQAMSRVTPAAQARAISLKAELEPGLPTCRTDSHRVEQILINLLGNAVRHTPDSSDVTVRVTHEDYEVVFSIEDQGPGVPEEEAERVFDVYATKGNEAGGTGLGLPLSRRLARLLGGELRVLPGTTGGRFVLTLPATLSGDEIIGD
ncbi:MAG: ATP-binding protein [Gemmatimonadota bacterium]